MTTTLIPQHMEALRKSHDAFCCARERTTHLLFFPSLALSVCLSVLYLLQHCSSGAMM